MKIVLVIAGIGLIMGVASCHMEEGVGEPAKDLSEQMDVLAILQETVGQDLEKGDWEGALQMANSMDSVFDVCSRSFERHHRLKEPFRSYYEGKMAAAMSQLRKAIRQKDEILAKDRYAYLVRRCNSCHNENDVAERAHE
ncbi:hypothetical protein KJS94_17530 [Flavihumibacter rivuli]|uniref:hypothetical protein n=1 Tax=Flavihumibacter rivuli TaxID=2838156 RepID=UPI001BDF56A3|nr:hypothetical protein [Flavihumibacter rivuli]ULQ56454.1 hypothetical protein KJS94_17530 [Flavihumibacter rivuli]